MKKLEEYLLMGAIVVVAVVLYLLMPEMIAFVVSHSKGTRGIFFLSLISLGLLIVFFMFGYRGFDLFKIALLILFIAAMVWLYFNYREIDVLISSRYGQLAATAVFLLIILLIWLLSAILL